MDLRAGAPGRSDADPEARDEPSSTSDRVALLAFVGAVVVAVPVLLWFGREQWFFLDELDFLTARDLEDPAGLLEPHNEHWTTLPIVVYRLIFQVVGARHYWPYLLPVITAHLAAACLLRVLMRRVGVHAWIATAACVAFVFLGSGREDIIWGFQITFTGALALGLAALVLADREGPLGLWDGVAVLCSVGALACSGIGVAMVAGVGVACAARHDARRIALHVGVPAAVFAAWYLAYGADAAPTERPGAGQAARFVGWTGVASAEGLARTPIGAVLLAAAAAAGVAVAVRAVAAGWRDHPARDAAWRAQADVVGLLGAAVLATAATAWSRAAALPIGRGLVPDRYVHVGVALLLPAIASGLDVAARRVPLHHLGVIAACLLLLSGLPSNVRSLRAEGLERLTLGDEEKVRVLAAVAVAQDTPADLVPYSNAVPGVPAGWLARALRDGDLRAPPEPLDPRAAGEAMLELGFEHLETAPAAEGCRPVSPPFDLAEGDVLTTEAASLTVVHPTRAGFVEVTFLPLGSGGLGIGGGDPDAAGVTLRAVHPLRVRAAHGTAVGDVVELCPRS